MEMEFFQGTIFKAKGNPVESSSKGSPTGVPSGARV